MKKKIITLTTFIALFFVLASCDILSTILAAKGLYEEYQKYPDIYNAATQYTILTEADLTITDTDIEGLEEIHTRVYVMLDKESPFLYVEQTLGDVSKTSIYEDGDDLYVEYLINDMVVTPTIPSEEDRFNKNTSSNVFNNDFNMQTDVDNENKTGTHTYEFDVYLNRAFNLEELSDFVSQLEIFGGDLSAFDNAVAHVVMSFTDEDSVIDIQVTLTDYTITFADETFVTLSLTSHVVTSVPDDFAMPNIFAAPYQMVAVDDITLARRAYVPNEEIVYPALTAESGWVQLALHPGIFELQSDHFSDLMIELKDEAGNNVAHDENWRFTVTEDVTYYLYVTPGSNLLMDLTVVTIEDHRVQTTTEATTTETVTTAVVNTMVATTEEEAS